MQWIHRLSWPLASLLLLAGCASTSPPPALEGSYEVSQGYFQVQIDIKNVAANRWHVVMRELQEPRTIIPTGDTWVLADAKLLDQLLKPPTQNERLHCIKPEFTAMFMICGGAGQTPIAANEMVSREPTHQSKSGTVVFFGTPAGVFVSDALRR